MELVDKIVDLIALIPGTFWGVVIGSLFSISLDFSNMGSASGLRI